MGTAVFKPSGGNGFPSVLQVEERPAVERRIAVRIFKGELLCDPSLAVAALGVKPNYFLKDFKSFGFVFESLVMRDLKVYSSKSGGRISYYRDRYGLEADAVLHLKDGRYALIEIKLGSMEIEERVEHLLKLRDLIRENNKTETQCPLREPDVLMVITGGKTGYTHPKGVKIIPISAIRH